MGESAVFRVRFKIYLFSCALLDSSMNRGELDVSYITSRLIVMSYPAEGVESAIKNHIDDVREFLDTHHSDSYAVYNLSNRSYRIAKFQNRVCSC